MPNQYLPHVPMELVELRLHQLWKMNDHMTDEVMQQELHKVFNTKKYCLDVTSIDADMSYLCTIYPTAGHTEMCKHLKHICGILAPEGVVEDWFWMKELVLFAVNDIWCLDQHDKWKVRFGICLYGCVDPFTGVLKWMNVWWNNSNPVLISCYYLDMVEWMGGPLLMQSDLGNKNGHLARAHTFLRYWQDPTLIGTLQHCWMREKKNLLAEIIWSVLCRCWSPGFEHLLQVVFHYVFLPWLQAELDVYVSENNNTKKCHNQKISRPNSVPLLIEQAPECFGRKDFKARAGM
ncbi:uncharacterized protein EV420DRAFT_1621513 [Desarmillaria tabescens]|uniref:Uncharacterized protein n=1 Tax=Armillaria tabescens TaxID=1929756 RepID=A0AA39N1S2_ARMTA|nr:uncharacterized protein EV420DRAFT_1621513 [Desarmillaria tabescens]KAK0454010.1 hypothetical protein EV420DRAFT_1621513 [Desarmillaria tabescens]